MIASLDIYPIPNTPPQHCYKSLRSHSPPSQLESRRAKIRNGHLLQKLRKDLEAFRVLLEIRLKFWLHYRVGEIGGSFPIGNVDDDIAVHAAVKLCREKPGLGLHNPRIGLPHIEEVVHLAFGYNKCIDQSDRTTALLKLLDKRHSWVKVGEKVRFFGHVCSERAMIFF